jgi:hypothetical protein
MVLEIAGMAVVKIFGRAMDVSSGLSGTPVSLFQTASRSIETAYKTAGIAVC